VIIVGVDPGLTGGIAWLFPNLPVIVKPMPVAGGEIDLSEVARQLAKVPKVECHVFLERAQPMPKQGVCSSFNYGASYWGVRGICAALGIPYTLVAPVKWHRLLCVGDKGKPKERALRACIQLFPDVELRVGKGRKPHEGVVDALLVAEFGRRLLNGTCK
jgi:crossover junction endodeoxyribonuclease RuvC